MGARPRPFRFGIQANAPTGRTDWVDLAQRAERLGYSTLTIPDHFDGQLSPIPALQCAADVTTTLRVGTLVLGVDYRHPVVLAKELATLDVLSGGRVEIGLGAGWMITDYEQSGITYDRPGVRVDRLTEAVQVIRSAHRGDSFSFDGEHYKINEYSGRPLPTQSPMPLLIGGGGKRMLTLAAQQADIVGVNGTMTSGRIDASTFESMKAQAVDTKVQIVREAAGTRFDDIELNIRAYVVVVTDDTAQAYSTLSEFTGASIDVIQESPYVLVGPAEQIIEDVQAIRERWGLSYFVVGQNDLDPFAPVVEALAGT